MKALVEYVAKSLADNPQAVTIQEVPSKDSKSLLLRLFVSKEDLGKIIGKQGRTAKALRTLACACTPKDGPRISLEINEIQSPNQSCPESSDPGKG